MWSLLVFQLLEHLEVFNVKITTFRKCVSKSATMVCLFLVFISKLFFSLFHSVVGAVLMQEVTRSQVGRRGPSVVVHGGGWGRRSCALEFNLNLPGLNQTT